MTRQNRAKQFAPFEALKGLREALRMKEYEHERIEKGDIQEEKALEISNTLLSIKKTDEVWVKYFEDGHNKEISGKAKIDFESQKIEIFLKKIDFFDILDLKIIKND